MAINSRNGNTLLETGFFPPCRVATTANIVLSGLQTIDGVALLAGDRVLVKNQTNAKTNGIYTPSTGTWVRTTDAQSNAQFFDGMAVVVAQGTVNATSQWMCSCTDDPVIIGTSLLTFVALVPLINQHAIAPLTTGPGSSTAGDVAIFADGTGKLLADLNINALLAAAGMLQAFQGKCDFVNDGNDLSHVNMALIPFDGNSMVLWNTATSSWVVFTFPPPIAVTGAADNGSGKVRITHAATARPFAVGQRLAIIGIGGTTEANDTDGCKVVTAVNAGANTFDLDVSFSNAYTSGGTIEGWVMARADKMTIDGVANQALSTGTAYLVGIRFLDAACTVAELVADTTIGGYNPEPTMGFNVLPNAAYAGKAPMVGMVYNDATLGVQGNGSSELIITWFHRSFFCASQQYTGNTGGVLNTPVALANFDPAGAGSGILKWLSWSDLSPVISAVFSITSTAPADIQVTLNLTGANTFSVSQNIRHSGTGVQQIKVELPVEDQNAGFFQLAATLQTDAGTATSGAVSISTIRVYTNF